MRDMTTAAPWQPQIPMDPKWIHLWMDIKETLSSYCCIRNGYTVVPHKRVHELKYPTVVPVIPVGTFIRKWEALHAKNPLATEVADFAREYVKHCFPHQKGTPSTSLKNGH